MGVSQFRVEVVRVNVVSVSVAFSQTVVRCKLRESVIGGGAEHTVARIEGRVEQGGWVREVCFDEVSPVLGAWDWTWKRGQESITNRSYLQ